MVACGSQHHLAAPEPLLEQPWASLVLSSYQVRKGRRSFLGPLRGKHAVQQETQRGQGDPGESGGTWRGAPEWVGEALEGSG